MDEQFVSIGKAAKMLGMSKEGLRKWEREGRLIPIRTLTNHRRYRVADLQTLTQQSLTASSSDRCILYARVSTRKEQEAGDLDRQLGRLTTFAARQQWSVVAALTDVASGLDEMRPGLHQLLKLAHHQQASAVVVEYRDRLTRFGVSYLETYLHAFGVRVIVMDQAAEDDQHELVEDLIAITTSFSARIDRALGDKKLAATVQQALVNLNQEGTSP